MNTSNETRTEARSEIKSAAPGYARPCPDGYLPLPATEPFTAFLSNSAGLLLDSEHPTLVTNSTTAIRFIHRG